MFPTVNLGPFVFPTAGLVYIFGAYICLTVVEKAAMRLTMNHHDIYGASTVALVSGLVGARLLFVVEYWAAFQENLLGIIWPLNSGYNMWGGVFVGIAAAFFYARAKQLPFASTMDALLPGIVSGLMVVSLADFLAGPGYGTLTNLFWGVSQFGIRRHPVQIYELFAGGIAIFAWWRLVRTNRHSGELALVVTAVYATGRLFFDAYRENTWLTDNGYHIIQIIALIVLLTTLFLLSRLSALKTT
jgi:phosphatidylglycerol---prolipoprotein diacylglyceryl transferase